MLLGIKIQKMWNKVAAMLCKAKGQYLHNLKPFDIKFWTAAKHLTIKINMPSGQTTYQKAFDIVYHKGPFLTRLK